MKGIKRTRIILAYCGNCRFRRTCTPYRTHKVARFSGCDVWERKDSYGHNRR